MAVQVAVFFPGMAPPSSSHSGALSEKPFLAGCPLSSFLPAAAGISYGNTTAVSIVESLRCLLALSGSGAGELIARFKPCNDCYGKSTKQQCNAIIARRLSGLEEAMRIRRLRELQGTTKVRKRPPLKRGKISGPLPVPDHIPKPLYVGSNQLPELSSEYQIHDDEGIARMRAACELASRVLDFAGTMVRPSVTTNEIDKAVHGMIIDAGAYPSPLGYGGFPKSVCTSVNECMCHGIPDSRQLQDGDIVNIDVTVYLNGYYGDTSKTFLCGKVNESTKRLVKVTEECLERAIAVCKDGASFKKIGKRISEIAARYGYGVVERFVGHGIGTVFHSEPIVMHNRNDKSGSMVEGQTFTIEPILTMGTIDCVTWDDGWTTLTADGRPAAQFEHTILVTRTGADVLTKC